MCSMMKKGLLFCLIGAFILSGTVVFAGEVSTKDDKVKVSLYGQVNRAINLVDDGPESYLTHVDNDNSSTRFGIRGLAKGSDNLTIGGNFEFEYQQNSSDKMSHDTVSFDPGLAKRKLEVFFDFSNIGKFTMGHGPSASDSTSEVDLSGSKVAGHSRTNLWAADYEWFETSSKAHSGTTVDAVINNLDGNGRQDRLRYDSPKFSGFMISASTFERAVEKTNDVIVDKHSPVYDIALRYSGKLGDSTKVAGAIAYTDYPTTDAANAADKLLNGSISVLFNGISLTFAGGQRDLANVATTESDTAKFYYGKLGYSADLTSAGSTAFAIDYGKHEEFTRIKNDEGTTYALYLVQKLNDYSTEAYAGYRIYKRDISASSAKFDDITALFVGARIKF